MKKSIFSAALLTVVLLSSCSDNQTQENEATTESHEGMNHSSDQQTISMVVVKTPDYTSVAAPVKTQIAKLVENYLNLKEALVAADAETAKAEAQATLTAANQVDLSALNEEQTKFATERLEEVKQSAAKMVETTDVSVQRESLELLSESTFALTKAFGATEETLYYQHCPMANNDQGAYWLSSKKEIRNPYFGDAMLTCGSNEEVFN